MDFNLEKHHRRSIRLKNYDYSQEGAYFITICTQNRECLFGEIVDGKMVMNEFGEIANRILMEIPKYFTNVILDEWVIMPNHIHCIIVITETDIKTLNFENYRNYLSKHRIKLYIFRKMNKLIKNRKKELMTICQALSIKRLYAFGSVVSGNFREDSDIDFLISFSDNLTIDEYTNNYFALQYKLRELFKRKVDIVTERTLSNPYFIESINESKQLIYEA